MNISNEDALQSAQLFWKGFSLYYNDQLSFPDIMHRLIAQSFIHQYVEELHDLSFTAKKVAGMKKVLLAAKDNPEVKDFEKLQFDYYDLFLEAKGDFRSFLGDFPDRHSIIGEIDFLSGYPEANNNLSLLIEDLSKLKTHFNRLQWIDGQTDNT